MTSSIGFYTKPTFFESNSFEEDDLFVTEENDENFAKQGYMYEVPNTSSSIDRSSIGSIPWADDAIKINKIEWEKVDKLLSGLEPIPDGDELGKEVLDWQKKFPQLLIKNQHRTNNLRSDTLDIESLPSFELTSYDEEYETEGNNTLTRDYNTVTQPQRNPSEEDSNQLCQLMDNFTLKSVPFKLSKREPIRASLHIKKSSSSSHKIRSPPLPKQVPVVSTSDNRFRMPPILNVLDSKRKFRSLGQSQNHSFVQLTQIQQVKSAAVMQEQKAPSRFLTGHRSTWHVPFVANRFSNNRNSIVLPSIAQTPTTSSTNSEVDTFNVPPPYLNVKRSSLLRGFAHNMSSKHQVELGGPTTNASTQTNTSNTTSGRSISAAVKYPRVTTYNALYLPYSASKFHAFH